MSEDVILYLVEGKKEVSVTTQIRVINLISDFEILPSGRNIVYGTTIYGLFKEVQKYLDEGIDFDLFPILTEIAKKQGSSVLDNLTRHDISEIYLIFDYDPHATNFSEEKIRAMCEIFNDEYTTGKLFINYPMIEVFRHCYKLTKVEQDFISLISPFPKAGLAEYKNHVSALLPEIKDMDCQLTIKKVILNTIIKSNFLITENLIYPENNESIPQNSLLEKQLAYGDNFHLLSGIPLFIHYYHRHEVLYNSLTN